jgi:hypothetical protein
MPDKIDPNGGQMGKKFKTALVQVFLDPYIIIGKA